MPTAGFSCVRPRVASDPRTADPRAGARAAIARETRARGALVNVMDDVPNCDWAAPAVVRRGDLVLAIGTGGASPAVARLIRGRMQEDYGAEWVELLRIVAEVRGETLEALPGTPPGPSLC